jgi:CBS domain-containing protein
MLLKVPYVSDYLIEMNLIIAGFNMLPVFPMDGGRVLRDVLWMLSGKYLRSTERAVKFGLACAKLFVAIGILSIITKTVGMGIWLLFIGVFVHVLGSHYGRQVRNSDALSGIVGTFMIPDKDVIKIHYEMTVKEFYKYFLTYGFHCYPVINDSNRVIGMVTYWHMKKNCRNDNDKVKDYMQPVLQGNAITVSKETDMVSAYEKMLFSNMSRLFVYDGDTFSGLITRSTVLRILGESHVM